MNFQIPKDTPIIFNAYNTAHNPEVYPEPFSCKPDRYLDKDGKVVPPGHPLRHKYVKKNIMINVTIMTQVLTAF